MTFLPYIGATGELKTKPTQHSVRELRSMGIQPQVIIARTDHDVTDGIVEKISQFCDVDKQAVVPLVTADNIYDVPLSLEDAGLGDYVMNWLNLEEKQPIDLTQWRNIVEQMHASEESITVGIVGKYVELHDAYLSVKEALVHAAAAHKRQLTVKWIQSDDLEKGRNIEELNTLDAIVVPGGFGYRGVEGKIVAARFARETQNPLFGLMSWDASHVY